MPVLKWTKEKVLAEAKKYRCRKEWRNKSNGSYDRALRKGWIDETAEHMKPYVPSRISESEVLKEAKMHKTRKAWREASPKTFNAAGRYKILKKATQHMKHLRKSWVKQSVISDAKKYKTKSDWHKNSGSAYAAAKRNGWHDEATAHMATIATSWTRELIIADAKKYRTKRDWRANSTAIQAAINTFNCYEEATAHMEVLGSKHYRCIYEIRVVGTKLRYIGLTYDYKRRIRDHLKTKRFTEISKKHGSDKIKHKRLSDYMSKEKAAKLEKETIQAYEKKGYQLLNKSVGGSLGAVDMKWTRDAVIADAKQYITLAEWKNSSAGAYSAARTHGCYKEATSHMEKLRVKRYKKEDVQKIALEFKTISEWDSSHPSSYNSARKNGWLDDCVKHMKRLSKPNGYWNKQRVLEEAQKYDQKSLFKRMSSGAYRSAIVNGWYEQAVKHMLPDARKK